MAKWVFGVDFAAGLYQWELLDSASAIVFRSDSWFFVVFLYSLFELNLMKKMLHQNFCIIAHLLFVSFDDASECMLQV